MQNKSRYGKMADNNQESARLLQEAAGKDESLEKIWPLVYDELKRLAARLLGHERANHTLQPTALVHEAYLKLIGGNRKVSWENRAHFFGIAAKLMREILVNHALARSRKKRGGKQMSITLDDSIGFSYATDLDVLALDEALETLAQLDKRQAEIVELRFFGGLTLEETAAVLDISTATVSREWEMARAWLYRQLSNT
jgi:RNA polymerase sigma-70 factor, ECF subfamily